MTTCATLTLAQGNVLTLSKGCATMTLAQRNVLRLGGCAVPESSGGTPGGSDDQIQFNDNGTFGGVAGSDWDGTTLTLPSMGTPSGSTVDLNGVLTVTAVDRVFISGSLAGIHAEILNVTSLVSTWSGTVNVTGDLFASTATIFGLPVGATAERPATPADGYVFTNTTLGRFEGYRDGAWRDLESGTPGGADGDLQFNDNGALGGISASDWDGSTLTLGVASSFTGATVDFSTGTAVRLPYLSGSPSAVNGEIMVDSTEAGWSHGIPRVYAGESLAFLTIPTANIVGVSDGHVLAYNSTLEELEFVSVAAGSSQWTLNGSDLHPNTSATTNAIVGGTTGATADHVLNADGSATINNQGNDADFRIKSSVSDEAFYIDGLTGNRGFGTDTPDSPVHIVTANVSDSLKVVHTPGFRGYSVWYTGESQPRFYNLGNNIWFGSGSAITDCVIYRRTTNTLQTLNNFEVGTDLRVGTTVSDSIGHFTEKRLGTNAAPIDILTMEAQTSNVPAVNFGSQLQFKIEAQVANIIRGGDIAMALADTTAFSEDTYFRVRTLHNGTITEDLRVEQATAHFPERSTDPPTISGYGQIYSKTVSSTAEVWVQDDAGNSTPISPHDGDTSEWIFYSRNQKTGRTIRVDMERFFKEKFPEYFQENMPLEA